MPNRKDTANETPAAPAGSRNIEVITAEIQILKEQAGTAIWGIGSRLLEAKEQLPHGEWLNWLSGKVEFSEATAQRFMRVAREYPNPSALTDLGMTKAITLLALPPDERDAFASTPHMVEGEAKTVEEMSSRELEKAIKERNEALAGKDAAIKQADINRQQAEAAESRADEAIAEAEERLVEAAAERQRLEEEKAALERRLEELHNADPAPAPDLDQMMLEEIRREAAEAAKQEAEDALKKQIEKASADKAKAEAAFKEAEKTRKKAEEDLSKVKEIQQREQTAFAGEKDALLKKLAASNSSTTAAFKVHFEAAQASMNKTLEIINSLDPQADGELLQKLTAAVKALCGGIVSHIDARTGGAAESA